MVKVEVINNLDRFEPTTLGQHTEFIEVKIGSETYRYGKATNEYFSLSTINHYPFVIDPDGSLWSDANRYILNRLNTVVPLKYRTLESIAGDLICFRRWMLEEGVDYLCIPPRPRARPPFRFCAFLHDEIKANKITPSTAKRRMITIQKFYRWLIREGHDFKYPLWEEKDITIMFKDRQGFQQQKAAVSTDLVRSFKTSKGSDDYGDFINDGGKLRPLPKEEQIALVESLKRVNNIEMTLAFLFALTTGARLQTVFTLRQQHFEPVLRDGVMVYRLKVGNGTLVDTKFGKQIVLLIPTWLYYRIQVYLKSERYMARVNRSKHMFENPNEQYAFLTRTGLPYYLAENDPFSSLYRTPPRGNSVTQFLRQQLRPDLFKRGYDFSFRFHDLRATFGMNLLEERTENLQLNQVPSANQPEFFDILIYVKERMGHSQLRTTEGYLNYRKKYHLAVHIQSQFEQYLMASFGGEESANELG